MTAMPDDYCDLCDLPLSTCVHGMPPARVAPAASRAPRAPRATRTPRAPRAPLSPPAPPRPRRWTRPEELVSRIVAVLDSAGGELDSDDLFVALEERLEGELLEGDTQLTPEGELRWRYAARRARASMIADGLMRKGAPGLWSLQ